MRLFGTVAPIWVPCESCDGTGHMSNDRAWEILQRDGVRPNQYFGCDTCDGMGEVESTEDEVML